MGKTDRPKEITLPQVNLEHTIFSEDEDTDEEYIIDLDDEDEDDLGSISHNSNMDLFELEWGDTDSNYFIEEITDDTDESMSETDDSDEDSYDSNEDDSTSDSDDSDSNSRSNVESEPEELDNSVTFDYDNIPDVYVNFSQSDNEYEQFSDDGSG